MKDAHRRGLRFYHYIIASLGKSDGFLINRPARMHPDTPALDACAEPRTLRSERHYQAGCGSAQPHVRSGCSSTQHKQQRLADIPLLAAVLLTAVFSCILSMWGLFAAFTVCFRLY